MKLITKAIPALLTSLMLTAPSFAAMQQADFYGKSCSTIAWEMRDLVSANAQNPCAGDLDIAAAYVDAADMSIRQNKVTQAIISLDYAVRELGEISHARTYCEAFAPDARHILADVIRARGELEAWERMHSTSKTAS